ncbi:MAG TPA: hypothetical protein PK745_00070 [bacterium]|nr:hypothetical protein [bacterium]
MFKQKISAAEYNAFVGDDAWKKNVYKKDGDNYLLDAERDTDTSALITAKTAEKDRADSAERRANELSTSMAALQTQFDAMKAEQDANKTNKNKKDNNIDALEKDWNEKITAEKEGRTKDREHFETAIRNMAINAFADSLATEISTSPRMMRREIIDQISVELGDFSKLNLSDSKSLSEAVKVRIMKDGQPSSMTRDEFKAALVANPDYKAIIRAGGGSGGGAGMNGQGGGAGGSKAFKDLNDQERIALQRDNPTEFARQSAEHAQTARGY